MFAFHRKVSLMIAGLIVCLGCAGVPSDYDYSRFRPPGSPAKTPDDVVVVYGTPRKRLDWVARALGVRDRLLSLNSKVGTHDVSGATIGKLKNYLFENDLTDVAVYVNHYDPKLQWRRMRENSLIAPGWRKTLGTLDMVGYTLVPGRIFGADRYDPYTNSLYINSDVPAIVLHEAAYAKDIHARRSKGTYVALNDLPIVGLWRHNRGIREVLGYARAKNDWELERSTYVVMYPRTGAAIAPAGAPLLRVWWGGPLLALGGAVCGHATGRTVAAYRGSQRNAAERASDGDAGAVKTVSYEVAFGASTADHRDGPGAGDRSQTDSDVEDVERCAASDLPSAATGPTALPMATPGPASDTPPPAAREPHAWCGAFDWLAPAPVASIDDGHQQLYLFHGYSSWRGIADGSGPNNNGFYYGANFGTQLGTLSDETGIGAQLGGSGGLYDLNGRASPFASNEMLQQGFITAGLFRRTDELTNFSGGVVFDGMFNDNFGQFAASPFLGQLRYQVAYALNDQHEFGMWGTARVVDETQNVLGPLSFRGVDQFNFFWHHRFAFGGDGMSWIGFPDHTKLGGNGSLGNYTFGGTLTAPLSPAWAAMMDLQYMPPTAHIGSTAAKEESFYVAIGVILFPGGNSRIANVGGSRWRPYLPVANNGSFMVDTNRTF
jgi:hypothetical protein